MRYHRCSKRIAANSRNSWRVRPAKVLAILALLGAIGTSGCCGPSCVRALCGPYEELKQRTATRVQAEMLARRIWQACYESRYANHRCGDDVKQGFIVAFVETALGHTGCPPPIPTPPLFSVNTLTHTYPDANCWYEGYHLGHANAVSRGVDRWLLAPINPELLVDPCQCPAMPPVSYEAGIPPPEANVIETLPPDSSPEPSVDVDLGGPDPLIVPDPET